MDYLKNKKQGQTLPFNRSVLFYFLKENFTQIYLKKITFMRSTLFFFFYYLNGMLILKHVQRIAIFKLYTQINEMNGEFLDVKSRQDSSRTYIYFSAIDGVAHMTKNLLARRMYTKILEIFKIYKFIVFFLIKRKFIDNIK